MHTWKQAYWLAGFELKARMKRSLLMLAFYTAVGFVCISSFDVYLTENFYAFDLLFLLLFIMFPAWMKPKIFQMQKMDGDLWTVPAVIMLQQLPVPKAVIVKSRFIIHSVYSFPYQLILLVMLLAVSPAFREMITPLSYMAFLIIWLAVSVAAGFAMAASEAGGTYDTKLLAKSMIYLVLGIAIFYAAFQWLADEGLIYWTIGLAQNWPLMSIVVSLLIIYAGWNYWQRVMKKDIEKADYL
ncbi:hypothetical protein FQV26_01185 [Planococcus sp. CPCC 101016]|uniref:hypothetical protein n=1 Tax=Planococcus sp. CPCC 101016 TaxID=2599617 RepID=UPI0011B70646|nr:hypothetical protein [Planococcus sp. CPCC 101016]TWT06458.1 hypothetical protein FQV26_01185 [Planococcus sp. CPCC 101016]